LLWAGDNNAETVFAVKSGTVTQYSDAYNYLSQLFGVRGQTKLQNVFPYGNSYGQAAVNPIMVKQWIADEPKDTIRRWGSIIDVLSPREGFKKYEIGGWNMVEETKLFIKKYALVYMYTDKTDKDPLKWKEDTYTVVLEGSSLSSVALQDIVILRYSDVLLMHSELTGTAVNLNLVRARAGLPAVVYSIENLRKERRYELAFEGIRYYDLLRWYGKEAGVIIDQNQNGGDILNDKVPAKYNADLTERIRATGGFFQIPESEVSLSNGVLKQNEGWSGADVNL
jgi:starch-binding outer membrane protein, SusD/RagB family